VSGAADRIAARDARLAAGLGGLLADIGRRLELNLSVELWHDPAIPLGSNADGRLSLSIASPGVVASLLRRPTLDRVIRHYLAGDIDFAGGTLIDIGEQFAFKRSRATLRGIRKRDLVRALAPFLLVRSERPGAGRGYGPGAGGEGRDREKDRRYIEFHYDVSNEFYQLFLDTRMIYSCGYFRDWDNSLDQAQEDKLEMICRKLRLAPGERLLDIGCGWGGLVCYAAERYGVEALGVTLSQEQHARAREMIAERGLEGRVEVRLQDYRDVEGEFDKISSVGMYEQIGVAAVPGYVAKVRSLLRPGGIFLNHGITRRGKRKRRRFSARAEQRALLRYIFPGGELDDIGHTVAMLEQARFEVHDVEAWRDHYALTTRLWCERLSARREEAIALVGEEIYRIWVAYLAGCSLAFRRGSVNIYQTVASRQERGPSPLPATREDLYRDTL
jgi:cyclopropane-fatty-acyl-phospholipid synthase